MGDAEPLMSGSCAKRTAVHGRPGVARQPLRLRQGAGLPPGVPMPGLPDRAPGLADHLAVDLTEDDLRAAEIVAVARPESLRMFDQIPMQAGDLAQQAKLVRPMLAGKRVAFMGDNDGASLVLGLMGAFGAETPSHMLLLDFDRRILARARTVAQQFGFADRLETCAYNAFEPVPDDLVGQFDVFYTNPPYGSANVGESGRLFITRGVELCHTRGGACGCIILPDDGGRAWTRPAMRTTQAFIIEQGGAIQEKIAGLHGYHLPSNPGLKSGRMWVSDVEGGRNVPAAPYMGRRVRPEEIVHFYGTKVASPYPRFVTEDGGCDYDWGEGSVSP